MQKIMHAELEAFPEKLFFKSWLKLAKENER